MSVGLVRQHLVIDLADRDEPVEVFTNVQDARQWPVLAKRHGWPSQGDDPVGYVSFIAWAAARRTGQIPTDMKLDTWEQLVVEITKLEDEPVTPTQPAPGAGSSQGSP